MNSELSHESFIRICDHISERIFRRRFDVFGLRLECYSDEFLSSLDQLWFELRYPSRSYSPAVTVVAIGAIRALVAQRVANTRGEYQEELRSFEREAEVLRDQYAERFNDPIAARFETDLQNRAAARAMSSRTARCSSAICTRRSLIPRRW
jgi:hypothetical protein